MLMELAYEVFGKAGWSITVQTERCTFPLGKGARNVAEK